MHECEIDEPHLARAERRPRIARSHENDERHRGHGWRRPRSRRGDDADERHLERARDLHLDRGVQAGRERRGSTGRQRRRLAAACGSLRVVQAALHAIGFLTRVPVPLGPVDPDEPPRLAPAVPWFPLVGALVGALAGGILTLVDLLPGAGPSGVAAALALAAGIVVTGALHEDGLADTADGLGVHGDRERRLAVLRDSRLGTFGALALLVWGLTAWSALRPLRVEDAVLALVAAGALSRWAIVLHAAFGTPARPDGAVHALRVDATTGTLATVAAVLVAMPALGPGGGAVAIAVAIAVALLTATGARRAFGGITGDTCGAAAALTQAAVLVVALAFAA
jgi:adenosylcobinamide-GDP ribazoletransferase